MSSKAVLCGINNYKTATDLRGCINDVENMKKLLAGRYGFSAANIHVLKDEQVTKKRLRKEWDWLMQDGQPGDTLVFHFSGHGSFCMDAEGEETEDGKDELFCLYDMDFNDPETYLLDDEVDVWTRRKPDGCDLVILTDSCHSGSATRFLERTIKGRDQLLAVAPDFGIAATGATINESEILNRLFVTPEHRLMSGGLMEPQSKRSKKRALLNHLHISACMDHEVAADAPIDGQYNGALTYYLCKVLSDAPTTPKDELSKELKSFLLRPPLRQTPDIKGQVSSQAIFGDSSKSAESAGAEQGIPDGVHPGDSNVVSDLAATVRNLSGLLAGKDPVQLQRRGTGKRSLVYVHGISEHPGDFSLEWWKAMMPHLEGLFGEGRLGDTRHGVHWSDIVNERAVTRRLEADVLRQMIEAELAERSAEYADPSAPVETRSAIATRGDGLAIDDFLRYMVDSAVRAEILKRFDTVVRPLLAQGQTVDIISHSWGTVVAYEGLLQLETAGLPGRVANLFTVGSALSVGPVRWTLNLGKRRPANVKTWVNVDAKGDSVGGKIGNHFPIDREYLELDPTGCNRGFLGYNLACAHGSYFKPENVQVNRDVFAWHLKQT